MLKFVSKYVGHLTLRMGIWDQNNNRLYNMYKKVGVGG